MVGLRHESAAPDLPPSHVTFDSRVACEAQDSCAGPSGIASGGGCARVQEVRGRQEEKL